MCAICARKATAANMLLQVFLQKHNAIHYLKITAEPQVAFVAQSVFLCILKSEKYRVDKANPTVYTVHIQLGRC
jgi:hypothetical protein